MSGIGTPALGKVTATASDGSILDGVDTDIKATVLDYTNSNPLAVRLTDTSGDYVAAGAGTQYTEGDTDASITGSALMWEDTGDTLQAVSAAKPLPVEEQGTVTVTATDLDIRNLTATDVVTANLSATDNAVLDNIDADTSAIQAAVELIDDAIYVDDADWTADTSKHVLVGGVTQATPSANTDGDVTPLITNVLRELRVAVPESDLAAASTTHVKKYYTSAGAVTDGIIWSPAAGKRWYLTLLAINVSAAATVTIEDDLAAGDSPVYKAELAANSGVVLPFPTPMFSGEDASDLLITTSAGNCYVTAVGYEV